MTAMSAPAAPWRSERRDQLGAAEEGVEVAARAARRERVVARVDVVGPDLEALDDVSPRARSAPISPQATVVLPAPELVPATTTRGITPPPPREVDDGQRAHRRARSAGRAAPLGRPVEARHRGGVVRARARVAAVVGADAQAAAGRATASASGATSSRVGRARSPRPSPRGRAGGRPRRARRRGRRRVARPRRSRRGRRVAFAREVACRRRPVAPGGHDRAAPSSRATPAAAPARARPRRSRSSSIRGGTTPSGHSARGPGCARPRRAAAAGRREQAVAAEAVDAVAGASAAEPSRARAASPRPRARRRRRARRRARRARPDRARSRGGRLQRAAVDRRRRRPAEQRRDRRLRAGRQPGGRPSAARDSAPSRASASSAGVRARSSAVGAGAERLARAVEDDEDGYHSIPCWARIPCVHRVLDLDDLGDEVGQLDQLGRGVASGDDDVLEAGTVAERRDDVVDVDPAPLDRVGDLVEQQELVALLARSPA